jgi:hypothetical protein
MGRELIPITNHFHQHKLILTIKLKPKLQEQKVLLLLKKERNLLMALPNLPLKTFKEKKRKKYQRKMLKQPLLVKIKKKQIWPRRKTRKLKKPQKLRRLLFPKSKDGKITKVIVTQMTNDHFGIFTNLIFKNTFYLLS